MRAVLQRLRRDGFAVLPGLEARLCDRLRALLRRPVSKAVQGRSVMESGLKDSQRGMPLPAGADAVFILGEPGRLHPAFARAAAHPRLVGLAGAVLGTSRLSFHFANVTAKAARFGSGIAWHRDATNRYMPSRRSAFLRVMLCLDGMGPGNGGTAFRPGSHRGPGGPPQVPRCRKGALVLIHARVLHGGAPNRSGRPRRNLVVQWGRRDDPLALPNRESQTGLPPRLLRRGLAVWRDMPG